MTGAFDPDAFDPDAFDTPTQQPDHGGHHWPRRPRRIEVTVQPEDAEEAALLIALFRHRFRI